MSAPRSTCLVALSLMMAALMPWSARAQQSFAIELAAGAAANELSATAPDTLRLNADVSIRTADVTVTCASTVDCTQLAAQLVFSNNSSAGNVTSLQSTSATQATFSFAKGLLLSPNPNDLRYLQLTVGPRSTRIPVKVAAPDPGGGTQPAANAGPAATAKLSALLVADCRRELQATLDNVGSTYANGRARFVADPLGNIFARPGENIDENDEVIVTVVGARALLSQLVVRRSSAFRLPGGLNILGGDADISVVSDAFQEQAAGVPARPLCGTANYRVYDFSAGRAEVEVLAETAIGDQTSLGKFDFGVNALYQGAISLGPVWSQLGDPAFGLVFNGQDSVVSQIMDPPDPTSTEVDGSRVLWGLFYHVFIPRRDVEKEQTRISPVIGVALNDVSENIFVGASIDGLASAYLTAGIHLGRITSLDERGGLKLGSPFDGTRDQIPTVKKWDHAFFIAATIDVRAAIKFLRVALSGAGGAAGGG